MPTNYRSRLYRGFSCGDFTVLSIIVYQNVEATQMHKKTKSNDLDSNITFSPLQTLRNITVQGYLNKLSPHSLTKSTKKRYFVLSGENLFYYTSNTDTNKPLGIIDMSKVEKVLRNKKDCFSIVTPKREFVLYTQTESELIYWLNGLRAFSVVEDNESRSRGNSPIPPRPSRPPVSPRTSTSTLSPLHPIHNHTSNPNSNHNHTPNQNKNNEKNSVTSPVALSPLSSHTKISPKVLPPNVQHREVPKRPIKKEIGQSFDPLKKKLTQLEESEQHLVRIRNSCIQLEKKEFKLLLNSLNVDATEKSKREISDIQQAIAQYENQIQTLEKSIEQLSQELQNSINNQMNWEKLKKLNAKK